MVRASIAVSGSSIFLTFACSALVDTAGLSGGDRGDTRDEPSATEPAPEDATAKDATPREGGRPTATNTDAAVTGPAPPGWIGCAGTATTCEIGVAECCVTMVGEASASVRRVDMMTARCMSRGSSSCGSYSTSNSTFTATIPQRCARAADCEGPAGSCCALPLFGSDRDTKEVGRFQCTAMDACASAGRILCASQSDCPATMTCTPETDPILSRLYDKFCL